MWLNGRKNAAHRQPKQLAAYVEYIHSRVYVIRRGMGSFWGTSVYDRQGRRGLRIRWCLINAEQHSSPPEITYETCNFGRSIPDHTMSSFGDDKYVFEPKMS